MGSFSRIERINGDKASLELHGSGDLHLGRILHNRRFDHAMVAFLDCLRQTLEFVKAQDPTVEFPHQLRSTMIGTVFFTVLTLGELLLGSSEIRSGTFRSRSNSVMKKRGRGH